MKILANDGISQSGIDALRNNGFEVITVNVAQEQLVEYINSNDIVGLLVRSATTARKELIDQCPGLKLIGRGGVGMDNIDVIMPNLQDFMLSIHQLLHLHLLPNWFLPTYTVEFDFYMIQIETCL